MGTTTPATRFTLTIATIAVAALTLAGCGGGGNDTAALCDAARDYQQLGRDAGSASEEQREELAAQLVRASGRVEAALPDDLRRELDPYRKRLGEGDASVISDPDYKALNERVEQHIETTCGVDLS